LDRYRPEITRLLSAQDGRVYLDVQRPRGTGHPVVLTINGKAELVVQDAASYQKLLDRMDRLEALDGIKRGRADVEAGQVTPLREFEREFRTKRGLPGRPR
jgi:PHD/YefM family antitoxin component YafN of YafNO toxin-antitoxin module